MATEAQRLMMVSIGKIQGCRQQRGGINLYKSLLVTKVLYHARSVALSESVSPQKERASEDQRVPEIDMNEEEEIHETEISDHEADHPSEPDTTHSSHVLAPSDYDNKENTPVNNNVPHNYPVHYPEDFTDSESEESSEDASIDRSCSRCAKRRLTEVEAAVDSITPKKQRTDCGGYEEQYSSEAMQVEPPQISTLVNSFSSGFTGLLATDSDNTQSHEEPQSEGHGHSSSSSDSLLSCSTQIKESFELLARPIIALSV